MLVFTNSCDKKDNDSKVVENYSRVQCEVHSGDTDCFSSLEYEIIQRFLNSSEMQLI